MKTYTAFATPKFSQTNEKIICHVKSKNIKQAKEIFKTHFKI